MAEIKNKLVTAEQVKYVSDTLKSQLSESIVEISAEVNSRQMGSDSASDFDISDENGNVLARFEDGHVKTKNFDSSNINTVTKTSELENDSGFITEEDIPDVDVSVDVLNSTTGESDFDISDDSGNVVLRVKDGHIKTKKFDSSGNGEKIITVKKDGTGDFTSIREAVDSITDASVNKPYCIDVYPGVYDVLADYTEAEIREAGEGSYKDNGMVGIKLKDGVSMRGVGRPEDIVIYGHLSSSLYSKALRNNISTLNLHGNGRLENLTVKAEYIRYCVHDDFTWTGDGTFWREVRNCRFLGYKLTYYPSVTYGAGTADGLCGIFEDCDFGGVLGIHTQSTETRPLHITVNNCTGIAYQIGDNGLATSELNHTFMVNNCNFRMIKIYPMSNVTDKRCHLIGSGNENAMIDVDTGTIYQTGAVEKMEYTYHTQFSVGDFVQLGGDGLYPVKATDMSNVFGVVVGKDTQYHYIQTCGYVNSKTLNLGGLSLGGLIGMDSASHIIPVTNPSEALGIVKFVDADGTAFIKLLF